MKAPLPSFPLKPTAEQADVCTHLVCDKVQEALGVGLGWCHTDGGLVVCQALDGALKDLACGVVLQFGGGEGTEGVGGGEGAHTRM